MGRSQVAIFLLISFGKLAFRCGCCCSRSSQWTLAPERPPYFNSDWVDIFGVGWVDCGTDKIFKPQLMDFYYRENTRRPDCRRCWRSGICHSPLAMCVTREAGAMHYWRWVHLCRTPAHITSHVIKISFEHTNAIYTRRCDTSKASDNQSKLRLGGVDLSPSGVGQVVIIFAYPKRNQLTTYN